MRQYIALIHKEAASDYGVSFPDVPGCITAGSTLVALKTGDVMSVGVQARNRSQVRTSIKASLVSL